MGTFEGRKLIAVGRRSGMGRRSAEDVVASGGSAVMVGRNRDRVEDTVDGLTHNLAMELAEHKIRTPAGSPARSSTSTAA